MIAAVAANNVIGCQNRLPWHVPGELAYFKAVTMGKPIIMGRRTFESLGRALPGRANIVVTRDPDWSHDLVHRVATPGQAVQLARQLATDAIEEVMVIGGGQLYRQLLPAAQRLYLTRLDSAFEGDTFFPELAESQWHEFSCEQRETEQGLKYRYLVLDRIGTPGALPA